MRKKDQNESFEVKDPRLYSLMEKLAQAYEDYSVSRSYSNTEIKKPQHYEDPEFYRGIFKENLNKLFFLSEDMGFTIHLDREGK